MYKKQCEFLKMIAKIDFKDKSTIPHYKEFAEVIKNPDFTSAESRGEYYMFIYGWWSQWWKVRKNYEDFQF